VTDVFVPLLNETFSLMNTSNIAFIRNLYDDEAHPFVSMSHVFNKTKNSEGNHKSCFPCCVDFQSYR
jgi:hypothetical protein